MNTGRGSGKILLVLSFSMGMMACGALHDKANTGTTKPPNVIYIFPDQFRQFSLGFWSQADHKKFIQGNPDPVITPNLDKLANEGIVFSRAVSNFPLCSPYRGMLLSGMYPNRNGLTNNCRKDRSDVGLRSDAMCMTDVFSASGYEVAYFGKCHWVTTVPLFDENGNYVGSTDPPGGHYVNNYDTYIPPGPDRHNIDYFFQLLNDNHFNPKCYASDPRLVNGQEDGEIYRPGKFSSEVEADAIVKYLANEHEQRDSDKPFFLMWSLNPPHNPWTEESTYMQYFDQYTQSGTIILDTLLARENADSSIGHYAPYYFANVSAVDFFIGLVLDKLAELNLDKNTMVVFSSDHGEMLGSHGLRGKNVPEIESFAIPFIIRWSAELKHRIEDLILSVPDVMPTLLGLAGLAEHIPKDVQGVNHSDILKHPNEAKQERPSAALFIQGKSRGLYTGKYMFVVMEKDGKLDRAFYYNNETDPYQLHRIPYDQMDPDLRTKHRMELALRLRETSDRWYEEGVCEDFLKYGRP